MVFKSGLMDRIMKGIFFLIQRYHLGGYKQGKGKFVWADFSDYEGEFDQNKIQGYGKLKWNDGK